MWVVKSPGLGPALNKKDKESGALVFVSLPFLMAGVTSPLQLLLLAFPPS